MERSCTSVPPQYDFSVPFRVFSFILVTLRPEYFHHLPAKEGHAMPDKISEPESKSRAEKSAEDNKDAPLFGRFSRRFFISQLGAAGIAATTQPLLAASRE